MKRIYFQIGIDSLTNVSGDLDGDLDPALGMYWAWNSGYINMKLEGKSSSCKSVKKEFQFHIGVIATTKCLAGSKFSYARKCRNHSSKSGFE